MNDCGLLFGEEVLMRGHQRSRLAEDRMAGDDACTIVVAVYFYSIAGYTLIIENRLGGSVPKGVIHTVT